MTSKTCLRCDWHGETAELACPSCAQRPLYVMSAPPSTSLEAASDRPTVRTDPSPPPVDPADPPRRPARSTTISVVAALAVLASFIGINALGSDEAPPRAATSAAPSVTSTPEPEMPRIPYVRGLSTLDLNTGETTPLPMRDFGDSVVNTFALSPDRSRLAYVGSTEDGPHQIFIARVDGTGTCRQVTHDEGGVIPYSGPAWSPDGSEIAFASYGGDGVPLVPSISVSDVATGESTLVTDENVSEWATPQFTPDGSSLLYGGGPGEAPVLRIVPVAGGESVVLFGDGRGGMGGAANGALSPDGSLVTMMGHEVGGPGAIRFVADVDGTLLRRIPGRASTPAGTWSPDGTRIVVAAHDRMRGDVLIVDVATGDRSLIAKGSGAIWLDDHTLLVEA